MCTVTLRLVYFRPLLMIPTVVTAIIGLSLLLRCASGSKSFIEARDSNGSVMCAVDKPSVIFNADQFTNHSSVTACVPLEVECAWKCNQMGVNCSSFNFRKDAGRCELFYYRPMTFALVQSCRHLQVTHQETFQKEGQSSESMSTETNVTSSLSSSTILASTTETHELAKTASANDVDTKIMLSSTIDITVAPISTNIVSTPTTSFQVTSNGIAQPTAVTAASSTSATTSASPASTAAANFGMRAATTRAPPPTVPVCPCDLKLSTTNVLVQVNQGNGLNKSWAAYKFGFADSTGGYWIGFDTLYQLTNNGSTWNLCIDIQDTSGTWYYAHYSSFVISAESDGYRYTVSGYTGAIYDCLSPTNRASKFSTFDQNNQPMGCPKAAATSKGGWWYPCSGSQVVLNGVGVSGFFWSIPTNTIPLMTSYVRISC